MTEPLDTLLSDVSAVLKDIYYHSRDHGGTMHTAADEAARALHEKGFLRHPYDIDLVVQEVIITLEPDDLSELDFAPDEPDYEVVWRCPVCLTDQIQEIDTALRWNDLELDTTSDNFDGWFIQAHLGRDADFENQGWQCANLHPLTIPGWLWDTVEYP